MHKTLFAITVSAFACLLVLIPGQTEVNGKVYVRTCLDGHQYDDITPDYDYSYSSGLDERELADVEADKRCHEDGHIGYYKGNKLTDLIDNMDYCDHYGEQRETNLCYSDQTNFYGGLTTNKKNCFFGGGWWGTPGYDRCKDAQDHPAPTKEYFNAMISDEKNRDALEELKIIKSEPKAKPEPVPGSDVEGPPVPENVKYHLPPEYDGSTEAGGTVSLEELTIRRNLSSDVCTGTTAGRNSVCLLKFIFNGPEPDEYLEPRLWKEGPIAETTESEETLDDASVRRITWTAYGYYKNIDFCATKYFVDDIKKYVKEGYDSTKTYGKPQHSPLQAPQQQFDPGFAGGYIYWYYDTLQMVYTTVKSDTDGKDDSEIDSIINLINKALGCMDGQIAATITKGILSNQPEGKGGVYDAAIESGRAGSECGTLRRYDALHSDDDTSNGILSSGAELIRRVYYMGACNDGAAHHLERDVYFVGSDPDIRGTTTTDRDGDDGGGATDDTSTTSDDSTTPEETPPEEIPPVAEPAPLPEDPVDVLDPCDVEAIASGSEFYNVGNEATEETAEIPTEIKPLIWQALISPTNNLSEEQVAAIMGNIWGLSLFNPASLQLTVVETEMSAVNDEVPAAEAEDPEATPAAEGSETTTGSETSSETSIETETREGSETSSETADDQTAPAKPAPTVTGIGLIHWVGIEAQALLADIQTNSLYKPFFSEDANNPLTPYNGDGTTVVDGDTYLKLASDNGVAKQAIELLNLQIRKILSNLDGTAFRNNSATIESAVDYFYNHLVLTDGTTPAPAEYLANAKAILEQFQGQEAEEEPSEDAVQDDPSCVDGFRRNPVGAVAGLLELIKAATKDRTTKAPAYSNALIASGITPLYDGRDAFAFVAAMVRASDFHPNYPVLAPSDVETFDGLKAWKKIITGKELTDIKDAELKPGDVLIEAGSSKHTMIYIGEQDFSDKKPFVMANTGNSFPYYVDRDVDKANIYNVWRRQTVPQETSTQGVTNE